MSLSEFKDFVEEVRSRCPTEDIVSQDAELAQAGNKWRCLSPLRDERDPSFFVFPDGGWFDFGIHEGGDVFDYVMRRDDCDFVGAVRKLADHAGLEFRSTSGGMSDETREFVENTVERRYVSKIITAAAHCFHQQLTPEIRGLIRSQYGFTDQVIDDFKIGWADGGLLTKLKQKTSFSHEQLVKSGLFIVFKDKTVIELFDNRIVFPYWRGGYADYMIARRVEGKTADNDYEKAKYKKQLTHSEKHSYVSPWVSNEVLYGEDSASRACEVLVITEGVTDAISCLAIGIPCISPVTIRFKKSDFEKLIRLTGKAKKVVVINDEEEPKVDKRTGRVSQPALEAAMETVNALFSAGRDARLLRLPRQNGQPKVDLNSFLKNHGKEEFLKLLPEAKPYPRLVIDSIPPDAGDGELDGDIAEACKVVSFLPPITRERYLDEIAKKYSVKRALLNKVISEDKGEGAAPGVAAVEATRWKIVGQVYEDRKRKCYYVPAEDHNNVISSFVLRPTERIVSPEGQTIRADVESADVAPLKSADFRFDCWKSKRDFVANLLRISPDLQWTGNDDNVQGLLRMTSRKSTPTFRGTTLLGLYQGSGGIKWIGPNIVFDKDGPVDEPDIRYIKNQSGFEGKLTYEFPSDEDTKRLAKAVMPRAMMMNTASVTMPAIGFTMACIVAPIIRATEGGFPLLWVFGTAGSGKTSMVRDVLWPLLGVAYNREPFAATGTYFTKMRNASCTTSLFVPYDEFKGDMRKQAMADCLRVARMVYGGEVELRGRRDQGLVEYAMRAPHCFIGETLPSEVALMERMICICPDKNALTPERKKIFRELSSLPIHRLAGPLIKFVIGLNIPEIMERSRSICAKMTAQAGLGELVPRVETNLSIMTLGLVLWESFAAHHEIKLPPVNIEEVYKRLVGNISEDSDDSQIIDAFDRFMESLSAYARMGHLKENVHYVVQSGDRAPDELPLLCEEYGIDTSEFAPKKDVLYLHLRACYTEYLKQRRLAGQEDETNGYNALRRVMREKVARGRTYIEEARSRAYFSSVLTRAVRVNPEIAAHQIDFDMFPHSRDYHRGFPEDD